MTLKKMLIATTAFVALSAGTANAEGLSANVGFFSDYVFRGVSQTDEAMSIQGGFDYEHETGLHAGVWGSTVDFNNAQDGSLELDITAGYANEVAGFSYDIGGIYYAYPGADSTLNYEFWEAYFSLGYQVHEDVALNAGVNYSPEYFGNTGDATYWHAGVEVALPYEVTAAAHVGRQEIDQSTNYTDWSLGLGYSWEGLDFSLAYTDTDLNQNDLDNARVVFGVSKSF